MTKEGGCNYRIIVKSNGGQLLGTVECDGHNCISNQIYNGGGGYPKVVRDHLGIDVGADFTADAHVEGNCTPNQTGNES